MAINALLEQIGEEAGIGFVDMWVYFVWERRHVYERWPPSKRKGRSGVLREPASFYGQWNRLQLFKLVSQGGGDTQRSQILEAYIKTAKRNQQRTAWKALRNLVINVFV